MSRLLLVTGDDPVERETLERVLLGTAVPLLLQTIADPTGRA